MIKSSGNSGNIYINKIIIVSRVVNNFEKGSTQKTTTCQKQLTQKLWTELNRYSLTNIVILGRLINCVVVVMIGDNEAWAWLKSPPGVVPLELILRIRDGGAFVVVQVVIVFSASSTGNTAVVMESSFSPESSLVPKKVALPAPPLLPLDDVLFILPSVPHDAFGDIVEVTTEVDGTAVIEEICLVLPSRRRRGTPVILLWFCCVICVKLLFKRKQR